MKSIADTTTAAIIASQLSALRAAGARVRARVRAVHHLVAAGDRWGMVPVGDGFLSGNIADEGCSCPLGALAVEVAAVDPGAVGGSRG